MEILKADKDFEPKHIFECGQVFRYFPHEDGSYTVISRDKTAEVRGCEIHTADAEYFRRYFDLGTDYGKIKNDILKIESGEMMRAATEYGGGIRILRQDLEETVFSFIISANNNIPRIRGIIERLSKKLGAKIVGEGVEELFAFPTAQALARENEDFYFAAGLGYRAPYILKTARMIADGFDFSKIDGMDSREANRHLRLLSGVGPKVADCVLLFGAKRTDVFPVDTWMEKVYKEEFAHSLGEFKTAPDASTRLTAKFGNLAGYAQQYLFFYAMSEGSRKNGKT